MTLAHALRYVFLIAVSTTLPCNPALGGSGCSVPATHPSAPTNLRHEWDACGNRYLAWDPVPGANGYGVIRFPCGQYCTPSGEPLAVSGTTALDPGVPSCVGCCYFPATLYEVYAFFPELEFPADRSCAGITLTLPSGAVPNDQQRVDALPIDPIVCAESSVLEFRAQVIANVPLSGFSYEWKRSGATVATTNAPSLTVPIGTSDDGAVYSVTASNGCLSLSATWPQLDVGAFPSGGPIRWATFLHSMDEYRFRQNSGPKFGPCGEGMCGTYQSLSNSNFTRDCPHGELRSVGATISLLGYLDKGGCCGGNHTCPLIFENRRWEAWTSTFTTTHERAVSVRGSLTSYSGATTILEVIENSGIVRTYTTGSIDETLLLGPGTVTIAARANTQLWFDYARVDVTIEVLPPAGDCNLNDVVDELDISSGTSTDIDFNGTPDECQTLSVPGQYSTIQAAIDAAPSDSMRIISVAPGEHAGPVNFLGKPVVVRGAGAGQTAIVGNGGKQASVVRFAGGETAIAALERVTVRGGTTGTPFPGAPQFLCGGGIFGTDSAASVRDCVIELNAAAFGGGAYLFNHAGRVERCMVRGNTATEDGGGLQLYGGSAEVVDSAVEQNSSVHHGAGLHLVQGTPTILRTTVRSNQSTKGTAGGISWVPSGAASALLFLAEATVSDNSANTQGGIGVVVDDSGIVKMRLRGTTVCGNAPAPQVSGVYTDLGGNTVCDCAGDLNIDGVINGADLGLVLSAWGPCGASCPYDLNADGQIDGADLGLVLSAWWGVCGG